MDAFFQTLFDTLKAMGPWGVAAFLPVYVFASFVFVPGPILGLAAGALFGVPAGCAVVSISSCVSAGAAFLAGRYWSGKWAIRKIASSARIKAIDDAVSRDGWKLVALLRLTAVLPFTVMNYALGLSKIRLLHYLAATWAGMLPATFLYVYLGSLAGDLALQKDARQKTAVEWVFFAVSLAVTAGMSLYATRVVRRAMQPPKKDAAA